MDHISKTGAYFEGKLAAFHQKGLDENPYKAGTVLHKVWREGWYAQKIVWPLPSGVTLIPTEHACSYAIAGLRMQAASLQERLEPYVKECWEHVAKVGGYWRMLGSEADNAFERYRQLYLLVGQCRSRLEAVRSPSDLEKVAEDLDRVETEMEAIAH